MKISHVWCKNTGDDLSSALSNYPTGGSTPLDNAKGCGIYMKMDDLINDGSTILTFAAPVGAPANGNG